MSAAEQLGLLDAWEEDDASRRRAAHRAERSAQQRRSWRTCWPEWEGPKVGGLCEVGGVVVRTEAGPLLYAYTELCRLIEERPDGTWLAVIEMGEVGGKPWPKDGTRLILEVYEIWAPCRILWPARHAAARAAETPEE